MVTDEELELYRSEIFAKHDEKDLLNEVRQFKHSGKSLNKNLSHFFKEIRYTALYCKDLNKHKSPLEILHDKEEMTKIIDAINEKIKDVEDNNHFYKDRKFSGSIDKYLNFNRGVTGQFDPQFIKFINDYAKEYYEDYFKRFNVHDASCGWGCRMTANIALNNNYHGTDPNTKLFVKLNEAKDFYLENYNKKLKVDIKCQGSEIFIPEWENKMDYSFTSPPYFDLEIYSTEETQSINKRGTGQEGYKNWLDFFVKPTIDNIHRYVIDGGFVGVNIKNYNKYSLYDDWFKTFENHGGFEFVEELELDWKNKVKNYVNDGESTYNEKIMIFKVKKT